MFQSRGARVVRILSFVAISILACPASAQGPESPAEAAAKAPPDAFEEVLAPLLEDRLFKTARVGINVVNARTGEQVFARNAENPMTPASTMKVLTAAVALRTLGPSYKYTTDFYVDEGVKVDGNGLLAGNLYVEGHGDPTLVVETLWKIALDLKLEGISKIEGNVVYDEDFFSSNYALPGWTKTNDLENGPSYYPSLGALSLNYNTVGIVVGPGPEAGKPARVQLETSASDYIEIENTVVTTGAGSRRSVRLEREASENGRLKFTLSGTVPLDADTGRFYRTITDPTAYFMAAFREMLASQGIKVTGKHQRGPVPETAELIYSHRSPSLTYALMEMNKRSNNFIAEQVLRTVGAEVYGTPGTTENGLRVVAEYLATLGIGADEYKLVNGSGLSRTALLRPVHFTDVLVDMAREPRVGHEFMASLAIAGRDGTLWRRLTDDPGRLRGKTGTIDGVHCLVGYVEASDGEIYAFSFLVNGIRGDAYQAKRLHDRFARRMFSAGFNGPEVVEGGTETPEEQPSAGLAPN